MHRKLFFSVTKQYRLGLLAVPDEVQKLAQPGTITLAQTMIELDEDSDCQKLPDKLFNIEIPGMSSVLYLTPERLMQSTLDISKSKFISNY